MPETLNSPQNALNSVDYFKAKLQFETFPHTLQKVKDNGTVLIVDVRHADAYAEEHIPGSINVPLEEIPKRLKELPKDKTIVTYCWDHACPMSTKAALELAHKDYKVQELYGGIGAWKSKGFETEGSKGRKRA